MSSPNKRTNLSPPPPPSTTTTEQINTLFLPFQNKMIQAGLGIAAISAFKANFTKLVQGDSGILSENRIDPIQDLPDFERDIRGGGTSSSSSTTTTTSQLLSQTVILKLNGGLGTSMGLEKAKSLLHVKNGETFLTLIAKQIKYLRQKYPDSKPRFILMNSFNTADDTLKALHESGHGDLAQELDVNLMQNQSPKVCVSDSTPVSHPSQPELEWCPPGHGDLYAALLGSGTLERLITSGYRYMFVSNSDNLGATLDVDLLRYFVQSQKPFLMEVARRSEADKKGGHLALYAGTQRLVLRESAMCPSTDMDKFQNIALHKFFNTNSIWLDLLAIHKVMQANGGFMPLPLIKNKKTVDPRDSSSTPVFQLETAMGAAIESFENAGAIVVPRSRFAPVKTTSDLFVLRSDAFHITSDFRIELVDGAEGKTPLVVLDDKYYKLVDQMDSLVQRSPSLVRCKQLTIIGPVKFINENIVEFVGTSKVTCSNNGTSPIVLKSGKYEGDVVI
jgi:UTP--glucose-1-phosphate uridylyltransferase